MEIPLNTSLQMCCYCLDNQPCNDLNKLVVQITNNYDLIHNNFAI